MTTVAGGLSDRAMEAGVVVAVITASASLTVALLNAGFTVYTRSVERGHAIEDRKASAKDELDLIREPLLQAALELAERIDNLRLKGFLEVYMTGSAGRRREIARTSTLYRIGRYCCVVQMLHDNVALHKLQGDTATRQVAAKLDEVGSIFASDGLYGRRFMIWRDEQRAIAEKMRTKSTPVGAIGYAAFVEQYQDTFAPWFCSFERDLDDPSAPESPRLRALQHQLVMLASLLDLDQAYQDKCAKLADRSRDG